MFETLYKNLILNKKISLAEVGVFAIEQQPAQIDFINKVVRAPKYVINFVANETEAGTENFMNEANEIKNICANNGTVLLPEIGNLKKENGDYSFESQPALQDFFPDIIIEKIIRKNAEHTIRVGEDERTNTQMHELLTKEKMVKDNWWIYAIILALIGIVALIIYQFTK